VRKFSDYNFVKLVERSRNQLFSIIVIIITIAFLLLPTTAASAAGWGYSGADNPTQWGKLDPKFTLCESGRNQSPIDLTGTISGKPTQLIFNYQPTPLIVVNTGRTIRVDYTPGSTLSIDGTPYTLLQFHFHTPSEHTIDGQAAAMELHLVHRNSQQELAVVGIMLQSGATNPQIERIWQQIPATGTATTINDTHINATSLLPSSTAHFSYIGSLTTPPCSEGVKWQVLSTPITISPAQLDTFVRLYPLDARPVQARRDRSIILHRD
jgi:carbonic anhydrase